MSDSNTYASHSMPGWATTFITIAVFVLFILVLCCVLMGAGYAQRLKSRFRKQPDVESGPVMVQARNGSQDSVATVASTIRPPPPVYDPSKPPSYCSKEDLNSGSESSGSSTPRSQNQPLPS
ncbi:hypothetical protein HYDPIDRAFT_33332 [Hydnomerulius pinastri MD-312]|uniref:Uncharacterized protein n=1 Tax=Hydnomerulius pinastri MD-312 TaxID=994086 RepID=A0A0C9W906_9AGAM|nr:hypothetical protein HYDPIDRAFT_33332 [Hydnomerulius pinastri MD-312]